MSLVSSQAFRESSYSAGRHLFLMSGAIPTPWLKGGQSGPAGSLNDNVIYHSLSGLAKPQTPSPPIAARRWLRLSEHDQSSWAQVGQLRCRNASTERGTYVHRSLRRSQFPHTLSWRG